MSTRGSIIVKSKKDKVYLFRHCDGYELHETAKDACSGKPFSIWDSVESFVTNLIHYDDSIREVDNVYTDSEYICVVDIDKHNIKMYDVEWFNGLDACEGYLDKYEVISDITINIANKVIDNSLAETLKEYLKSGIAAFKYVKTNGEIRKAFGTLNSDYSVGLASYMANRTRKTPEGVVTYWDLEKNDWRTVKNENILEIF